MVVQTWTWVQFLQPKPPQRNLGMDSTHIQLQRWRTNRQIISSSLHAVVRKLVSGQPNDRRRRAAIQLT